MPIKIQVYAQEHKNTWDEFVRQSKNGTFLFLRDYMDYHRDRFQDQSLLIWSDNKLSAVLPANQNGKIFSSHGGLTYGGFITDELMKTPKMIEIFETTLAYLQQNSFQEFIYKTIPYIYHRYPSEEDRYALFLSDARLKRRGVLTVIESQHKLPFQDRRNRGIKKAVQNGLAVRQSRDFEMFWELLSCVLWKTYNTRPVHSLAEIDFLQSKFPENIKLFASYQDTTMLAGVVVYESEQVAHVQYIASGDRGRELGALDFVFDCLIHDYYSHKPFFDFGTSDENDGHLLNKGLIDQKEGFGARVVVHDHYVVDLTDWQPGKLNEAMQ